MSLAEPPARPPPLLHGLPLAEIIEYR